MLHLNHDFAQNIKKTQRETQKYDGFYNSENLTHHVTVIIQHL